MNAPHGPTAYSDTGEYDDGMPACIYCGGEGHWSQACPNLDLCGAEGTRSRVCAAPAGHAGPHSFVPRTERED